MNMTRDEVIAFEMAIRNYQEQIEPVIASLTSPDAKKGYAKGMFIGACKTLTQVTGGDFEDPLEELVGMVTEANNLTRP